MKLHKPLLNTVISALHKIINEHFYSDKVLEYIFKSNKKLGKRDRQFIAETTYNIVRYFYLYQHIAQSKDIPKILNLYLEKNISDLLNDGNIPDKIKLSYNNDLWDTAEKHLGKEQWLKEAKALNNPAPLVIRTNTLKISKHELRQKLFNEGIETIENKNAPEALIITNKKFLNTTELFKSGYYEFQDISSQRVAHFIPKNILMNAKRVIDACAGAGGKTLHLAALLNNQSQIIALDIEEKKLSELRKRANRAGITNIQTKIIDNSKTIKRLHQSADILLIDAPCTGTGVIKRNPDAKLKFTTDNLTKMIELQRKILNEYSEMTKPQKFLLYVTCSILPPENEEQINWFLIHNSNFELIKQQTLYPSEGFDGFYMALLKRK